MNESDEDEATKTNQEKNIIPLHFLFLMDDLPCPPSYPSPDY